LKSFTRNHINPQGLRADKRFDAVVRKHEIEQQHVLSGNHKEMQALREMFQFLSDKATSLSEKNDQELKDFKTDIMYSLGVMKEKIMVNDSMMAEQRRALDDLHHLIGCLQLVYAKRDDLDSLRKETIETVKEATSSHLNSFQDLQREIKDLLKVLKNDFEKHKTELEKKFSELIDMIEQKFNVTKIDREGVLKEIRVYEKTIFIIEKKLENIYTLIERINKKGESCHKPE
jgi:hypothetical protein